MVSVKSPQWVILGTWQNGRSLCKGYMSVADDGKFSFISEKKRALVFDSQVLARGYLNKAMTLFKTYKLSIVQV